MHHYICKPPNTTVILNKKKMRLNTLFRYQIIKNLYLEHKTPDIPTTVILKKYIFPFFVNRQQKVDTIL